MTSADGVLVHRGQLTDIVDGPQPEIGTHDLCIIAIPEIGANAARSWSNGTNCWLTSLFPQVRAKTRCLEYSYNVNSPDGFAWRHLVGKGEDLIECLLERDDLLKAPVIFVSHGFGGVVLKRALGVLYERFYYLPFQQLITVLSGYIFLGCPHTTYAGREYWYKLELMLKFVSISRSRTSNFQEDAAVIANVNLKFEEAGFDTPVMSVYETRLSKVKESIFKTWKGIKLVDEQLARTNAKYERLSPSGKNHRKICDIDAPSPLLNEISVFAEQAAVSGSKRIALNHPPVGSIRGNLSWTLTTSNVDRDDMPISTPPSQPRATDGSNNHRSQDGPMPNDDLPYARPAAKVPCHMLSPYTQNPDFHGRQDILAELDKLLLPAESRLPSTALRVLKTFALCGLGGLGKTQIAIEFAYSRQARFDAIFFVSADTTAKLAAAFDKIAIDLGLENASDAGNHVVSRDLVLQWLSEPKVQSVSPSDVGDTSAGFEATWLLIFDNADDPNTLNDYWPVTGNGSVLVTSRDPLAKRHIYSNSGIDLGPLEVSEAATLLRNLTGNTTEEDEKLSTVIADRLGGLPLALTQIAGTISRRDLSFSEFLDFYDQESLLSEFHKTKLSKIGEHYSHNLYTVWALEDLSPPAKDLLDLMAVLDPDCIPEMIIAENFQTLPLEHFPATPRSYVDARVELSIASLCRRNRVEKEISTHRMIQDVARAKMDDQRFTCAFRSALSLVSSSWIPNKNFNNNTERWAQCERILPHIARLKIFYEKRNPLHISIKDTFVFAKMLNEAGWYLFERGNVEETHPFYDLVQTMCDQHAPEMTDLLADNYFCKSATATHTNAADDALIYCERNLELRLAKGKEDCPLGNAHGQLGIAYIMKGRYAEAIEQCRLSITISKPLAARGIMNLPNSQAHIITGFGLCLLERYDEAEQILLLILTQLELKQKNDFKIGLALHALGNVRAVQLRLEDSFDCYKRALEHYQKTIGKNHHRTADIRLKMADHLVRRGDIQSASSQVDHALRVYGKRAVYKPEICRATFIRAEICRLLGEELRAEVLSAKATEMWYELVPAASLRTKPLQREDFDDLVTFWSK